MKMTMKKLLCSCGNDKIISIYVWSNDENGCFFKIFLVVLLFQVVDFFIMCDKSFSKNEENCSTVLLSLN